MQPNFALRPFVATDLQAVLDIWMAAMRLGRPRFDDRFLSRELARVCDTYLPVSETTVATFDGEIIGFTSLLGHQLAGLFVTPTNQGRGLGQILLSYAIAKVGDLEVDVFAANHVARRLYERNGFLPAGEYAHPETGLLVLRLTRLA